MKSGFYEAHWPRDGLYMNCYVHKVMNFRYHWHPNEFELSILLNGEQYFCRGTDNFLLQSGDVILIDPNIGHASYGQTYDTIALVLRFSNRVLKHFVPKNYMLSFSSCLSNQNTRNKISYKKIRSLASQIILALYKNETYANYTSKACLEMIISILCNDFSPNVVPTVSDVDEDVQKTIHVIISYIETHYSEKITLEDISNISQNNRTYISTLFKKVVGIRFYDYLMRVRLQHALKDLVTSSNSITEVAISNGFSDLKSFNIRFKQLLRCTPAEYRKKALNSFTSENYYNRKYIDCNDPYVRQKLIALKNEL